MVFQIYQVIGKCTVADFPVKGIYDVRLIWLAGFGVIFGHGFIHGLKLITGNYNCTNGNAVIVSIISSVEIISYR